MPRFCKHDLAHCSNRVTPYFEPTPALRNLWVNQTLPDRSLRRGHVSKNEYRDSAQNSDDTLRAEPAELQAGTNMDVIAKL